MPFLIDGHNLIGQLPELSLSDPEDEVRLIALLRAYCGRAGKQATVYFDQKSPGVPDPPKGGGVSVHFVRSPRTADDAIAAHLARLKGAARNWTVVSSDRAVQQAARASGARTIPSKAFARQLTGPPAAAPGEGKPEEPPSPQETAYWERRFASQRKGKSGPE